MLYVALYLYAIGFLAAALRATDTDSLVVSPIRFAALWPVTAVLVPLMHREASEQKLLLEAKHHNSRQREALEASEQLIAATKRFEDVIGVKVTIKAEPTQLVLKAGLPYSLNGKVLCRCNGGSQPCPLPPSEGPMR